VGIRVNFIMQLDQFFIQLSNAFLHYCGLMVYSLLLKKSCLKIKRDYWYGESALPGKIRKGASIKTKKFFV
jgi:hypothetical protein